MLEYDEWASNKEENKYDRLIKKKFVNYFQTNHFAS